MQVYSVTSAPAAEPLVRADIKNYLKVPSTVTTDDDLIDDLITEAREFVERMTSRALITQTITEYWDEFPTSKDREPRVLFPTVAPVQSVTSVSYIAEGDTPASYTTWASSNYTLDAISGGRGTGPARIVKNPLIGWPDVEDYYNAVKVVYVAGYGASGSSVPGPLLTAMRRLIGIWYYGRDNRNLNDYEVVAALLNPYKVYK